MSHLESDGYKTGKLKSSIHLPFFFFEDPPFFFLDSYFFYHGNSINDMLMRH